MSIQKFKYHSFASCHQFKFLAVSNTPTILKSSLKGALAECSKTLSANARVVSEASQVLHFHAMLARFGSLYWQNLLFLFFLILLMNTLFIEQFLLLHGVS